jgi:hypothetical protein
MTLLEEFRLIAPEFVDVPDDVVNFWLEQSKIIIAKKPFRKAYKLALILLTAHQMKLQGLGNGTEPMFGSISKIIGVSSFSEGDSSVSFGGATHNLIGVDAEYGLTIYGVKYLTLRRRYIIPLLYG